MNKLYYGDNLDVLRRFVCDETVDLCYIDTLIKLKKLSGRDHPALTVS